MSIFCEAARKKKKSFLTSILWCQLGNFLLAKYYHTKSGALFQVFILIKMLTVPIFICLCAFLYMLQLCQMSKHTKKWHQMLLSQFAHSKQVLVLRGGPLQYVHIQMIAAPQSSQVLCAGVLKIQNDFRHYYGYSIRDT